MVCPNEKGHVSKAQSSKGKGAFFKAPVSVTAGAGTYVLTGQRDTLFPLSHSLSPNLQEFKGEKP